MSSYRDSFKATSLFGSIQVINIIVRVIKSKFVAVLIGPTGMGIVGLLSATIDVISASTNFGLRTSSVRNIVEANAQGDKYTISAVISVLKRLVWITGTLGAIICIIGAKSLSRLTFGNPDFTVAFTILSVNILLIQLTNGHNALLQGLQKYKYIAQSNVFGNIIGLIIALPLYFFFSKDAIVPVLIFSNLASFLLALYFSNKINVEKISLSVSDFISIGGNMVKMGGLIGLKSLLAIISAYLIRVYISFNGSISDVGLFKAGFTIVDTYIGLILAAMAVDYYPRLSKAANDNSKFIELINQRAELVFLMLIPVITIFIAFSKYIIIVLYSVRFAEIEGMINWAIAATLFKAFSWTLSYSVLAKQDIKAFFGVEFSVLVYGLVFNALGYHLFGLTGLGISSLLKYSIYFVWLLIITKNRYGVVIKKRVWIIYGVSSICLIMAFLISHLISNWMSYFFGTILFIGITIYSFNLLEKRVGIKGMINKLFFKK